MALPHDACCISCGYSIIGLPECRCPECGLQFDPADSLSFRSSVRRPSYLKRLQRRIEQTPPPSVTRAWLLTVSVLIILDHRSGGIAFLARPDVHGMLMTVAYTVAVLLSAVWLMRILMRGWVTSIGGPVPRAKRPFIQLWMPGIAVIALVANQPICNSLWQWRKAAAVPSLRTLAVQLLRDTSSPGPVRTWITSFFLPFPVTQAVVWPEAQEVRLTVGNFWVGTQVFVYRWAGGDEYAHFGPLGPQWH